MPLGERIWKTRMIQLSTDLCVRMGLQQAGGVASGFPGQNSDKPSNRFARLMSPITPHEDSEICQGDKGLYKGDATHCSMGASMRRSSWRAHRMWPVTGGVPRGSIGRRLPRSYAACTASTSLAYRCNINCGQKVSMRVYSADYTYLQISLQCNLRAEE